MLSSRLGNAGQSLRMAYEPRDKYDGLSASAPTRRRLSSFSRCLEITLSGDKPLRASGKTIYRGLWHGASVRLEVLDNRELHTDVPNGVQHQNSSEEYERLAQLQHPNILQFFGICDLATENKKVLRAFVAEFRASTLFTRYQAEPPLTWSGQLRILSDVAAGLCFLHAQGLVHCELTSSNVFLAGSEYGPAKITLGRAVAAGTAVQRPAVDALNGPIEQVTNAFLYQSPDAATAKETSELDDVFTFGVLTMVVVLRREPSDSLLLCDQFETVNGVQRPVSELRRREVDLKEVPANHPLRFLVIRCFHRHIRQRPTAAKIHQTLDDLIKERKQEAEEGLERKEKAVSPWESLHNGVPYDSSRQTDQATLQALEQERERLALELQSAHQNLLTASGLVKSTMDNLRRLEMNTEAEERRASAPMSPRIDYKLTGASMSKDTTTYKMATSPMSPLSQGSSANLSSSSSLQESEINNSLQGDASVAEIDNIMAFVNKELSSIDTACTEESPPSQRSPSPLFQFVLQEQQSNQVQQQQQLLPLPVNHSWTPLDREFQECSCAITKGAWPCTRQDAVELAAIHSHVGQDGDFKLPKSPQESMSECLPPCYAANKSTVKLAVKTFLKQSKLSSTKAKEMYIAKCKQLAVYETLATYEVKEPKAPKTTKNSVVCLLALTTNKLLKLDLKTKEVYKVWLLSSIKSARSVTMSSDVDKLKLEMQFDEDVTFLMESGQGDDLCMQLGQIRMDGGRSAGMKRSASMDLQREKNHSQYLTLPAGITRGHKVPKAAKQSGYSTWSHRKDNFLKSHSLFRGAGSATFTADLYDQKPVACDGSNMRSLQLQHRHRPTSVFEIFQFQNDNDSFLPNT